MSSNRGLLIALMAGLLLVVAGLAARALFDDEVSTTVNSFDLGSAPARQTITFDLPDGWARAPAGARIPVESHAISFSPMDASRSEPEEFIAFQFEEAPASRFAAMFGKHLTGARKRCPKHTDKPLLSELANLASGTFMVLLNCPSRLEVTMLIYKEAAGGMLTTKRGLIQRDGAFAPMSDDKLDAWLDWANTITLKPGG